MYLKNSINTSFGLEVEISYFTLQEWCIADGDEFLLFVFSLWPWLHDIYPSVSCNNCNLVGVFNCKYWGFLSGRKLNWIWWKRVPRARRLLNKTWRLQIKRNRPDTDRGERRIEKKPTPIRVRATEIEVDLYLSLFPRDLINEFKTTFELRMLWVEKIYLILIWITKCFKIIDVNDEYSTLSGLRVVVCYSHLSGIKTSNNKFA